MPGGKGQINAKKQQQQNIQQVHMDPQTEALKSGFKLKEFQELEQVKKEKEDLFYRLLLTNDEKYKELGELLNYVKERNQKDWTQNFDECGKQSEEILEKFKGLYAKNAGIQNWQEQNQELAQLKAESKAITETMIQRDKAQAEIRDNTSFKEFDKEIRTMIKKSSATDSKTYKMVIEVAKEYLNTEGLMEQLDVLWRLQACMKEYAKLRYKTSYKTDKGKERMTRITKLLAMTYKFMECKEYFELRQRDLDRATYMSSELKDSDLTQEYIESKNIYATYTKVQFDQRRWPQIMLPYKRDKKNKNQVTTETRENYEIDKKFLRAYQSQDINRQIAAIARIYLKQPLQDFSKEDLTMGNVIKFTNARYVAGTIESNKMILSDFITELERRIGRKDHPLLKYMGDRVSDPARSNMACAFGLHMGNLGISISKCQRDDDVATGKEEEERMYQAAQEMYSEYRPIDEELEKQLREFVEKVDKEELEAEKIKGSHEYVKETCRLQVKKEEVDKQAGPLIKEHYANYLNGDSDLGSLLIPFYIDKNGEVTNAASKANKAYNDKFLTLIHSNDPEDRVAALASVYLRLKKFNWGDDEPSLGDVAEFGRQMVATKGFASQYQAFNSCLQKEAEKTDHPMLYYMQGIYDRPLTTYSMNLVRLNNYVNGYDSTGDFMEDDNSEMVAKESYTALLEKVKEEMELEKANHGGHVIQQDLMMEEMLKQLCQDKGIAIM